LEAPQLSVRTARLAIAVSNKHVFASIILTGLAAAVALADAGQPAVRSQWQAVFTAAQAFRGRDAYAEHCANCHGVNLAGLPQEVRYPGQLPFTPALVGDQFAANWNGLSLGGLFERIKTSMPQQSPGVLPRQTVADILAFMLEQAGYLPGGIDLPAGEHALENVIFLKTRP
jgi:mono/diheme cytochrome c family protein